MLKVIVAKIKEYKILVVLSLIGLIGNILIHCDIFFQFL